MDQLLSERSNREVDMTDKYAAAVELNRVYGFSVNDILKALNNGPFAITTGGIIPKVTERMVINHLRGSRNIAEISKSLEDN